MSYKGSIRLPTIRCIALAFPLLLSRGFRCIETGAILLLSTDPNVAGETCLANPPRSSGFQAARHSIVKQIIFRKASKHAEASIKCKCVLLARIKYQEQRIYDLGLSWQSIFWLWPSELWHNVVLFVDINFSEKGIPPSSGLKCVE
jgi:hypothetical protein